MAPLFVMGGTNAQAPVGKVSFPGHRAAPCAALTGPPTPNHSPHPGHR
jgi:hypothetical protein